MLRAKHKSKKVYDLLDVKKMIRGEWEGWGMRLFNDALGLLTIRRQGIHIV